MTKLLARWLHQKLNVLQQQEKQHVHEKEMQQQKLQHDQHLQEDVHVVHQQKDLQDEVLQADELQANELQANELQANELQEKLLGDLPHEEGDVTLLFFFIHI